MDSAGLDSDFLARSTLFDLNSYLGARSRVLENSGAFISTQSTKETVCTKSETASLSMRVGRLRL